MLQQRRAVHVVVLAAVCEYSAHLRARQRLIVAVLPCHGQGRQVPVVTAGNSSAIGIALLMTGRAIQAGDACAFRTAHHVGKMTMAIVTLLRVVRSGVTVDAPWMR